MFSRAQLSTDTQTRARKAGKLCEFSIRNAHAQGAESAAKSPSPQPNSALNGMIKAPKPAKFPLISHLIHSRLRRYPRRIFTTGPP